MKIRYPALAAACALAFPLVAQAADPEEVQLGHVVVTATRQPISASEALASVDVIDRDEIAAAGNASLVDLLASRPGVQVTSNGGPGSNSSVFIRGATSGHTLVLIDGMRVGSATSGAPTLETIPLALIDRVEILRGPASALYGSDAIGGVIQVFTRKGSEGFHPTVRIGAGTDNARAASAALAGGTDRLRYSLAAGHDRSDGINAKPLSYRGRDQDDDGFRNDYFSGSLTLGFRDKDEIGLTVLHSDLRNWYDTGNAFDAYLDKRADTAGVHMRNQLTADWASTVRAGYSADTSRNRSNFTAESEFNTYQSQFTWQNDIALGGGSLLAAYEFLQQNVDTTTAYAKTRRIVNSALLGWGGQFDRHHVQVNARHDRNSQFGNKTTGSAAYGYQFAPEWRVRGSIGTAFKAPSFNDLYYPVDCDPVYGCFGGNPELKAEEAVNREIGLVWERKDLSVSATYFNNRVKNLIDWSTGIASNVATARLQGVELGLSTMLYGNRVRASLDYLDAEDKDTGDQLGRRARVSGSLAIERNIGLWTVGMEWNGQGRRYDRVPNVDSGRMAGYGLLNAYAHYALAPDWSVELRANNLLDKDYELAKGYGTQGFNAFVALRYAMH